MKDAKLTFNKKLLWDYDLTEEDLENENLFIFYLSRLLNNGSFDDVQEVPPEVIEQYLYRLHLSGAVRRFWQWYLKEE